VENKSFRDFFHALNPTFKLPNKKKISHTLIHTRYKECLTNCRQKVSTEIKTICLTTDCWTSVNGDNFLALTGHYIDYDFNIKSIFLECSVLKGHHISPNLAATINRIVIDCGLEVLGGVGSPRTNRR